MIVFKIFVFSMAELIVFYFYKKNEKADNEGIIFDETLVQIVNLYQFFPH